VVPPDEPEDLIDEAKDAPKPVRVGLPVSINDRDGRSFRVGPPPGDPGHDVLRCGDGLLTRLMRYADSPVGRIVTQYDYEDYRPVAGVRIPFKWTRTWLDGRSVFQLTDVQPNVNMPADRFAGPPQRQ
jgi:hypothetical protein